MIMAMLRLWSAVVCGGACASVTFSMARQHELRQPCNTNNWFTRNSTTLHEEFQCFSNYFLSKCHVQQGDKEL